MFTFQKLAASINYFNIITVCYDLIWLLYAYVHTHALVLKNSKQFCVHTLTSFPVFNVFITNSFWRMKTIYLSYWLWFYVMLIYLTLGIILMYRYVSVSAHLNLRTVRLLHIRHYHFTSGLETVGKGVEALCVVFSYDHHHDYS